MKNLAIMLAVIMLSMVYSCKPDAESTEPDPIDTGSGVARNSTSDNPDKELQLGKKLENPYTLENMRKAYANLGAKSQVPTVNIETNSLYIRFLPKDEREYKLIHQSGRFDLYNHPLDYEIKVNGNRFKDFETVKNLYTWYYCSVKAETILPEGIKTEILAALYLPLLPEERNRLSESEIDFRKALEKEALRITGNSTDVKTGRIARYTPSGRITMTDNRLGIIGVEGVRVRANRWFTTHEAITDVNGFFMMDDTFDNPCNYSIKWERADFDILEGGSLASFQAYYNGPKQSGSWNLNIDGGQSLMYAAIHRAAIRYFYKNNDLRTPRNGSFWSRVSIAAYDWESPPSNGSFDADGFQTVWLDYPDIRIYRPSRGPYALYSTAIHELAHASHWAMDRWNNRNSDKIINESWARCVQWHFTSLEYGNNWDSGIQYSNPTVQDNFDNVYTPIFIDLIDNVNQAGNTYFSEIFNQNRTAPAFMVDNVNGYSIRQLEDILVGSRTMLQLRDNLRDAYVNPTEGDLNQLFASYGFQ